MKLNHIVAFLLFVSCSSLDDRERKLVGGWRYAIESSVPADSTFGWKHGIVRNVNGKLIDLNFMMYDVQHWHLAGDTLVLGCTMNGGVLSVPGKKDTLIDKMTMKIQWLIHSVSDDTMVAENINDFDESGLVLHEKFTRIE
jgi:hypothetical protein